jgi:hypothetical protein
MPLCVEDTKSGIIQGRYYLGITYYNFTLLFSLASYMKLYNLYSYRNNRRQTVATGSEGSSSPPPPPPPPLPPGSRHTLGSPRSSPRMTKRHHQVSASLATTPTQSTLNPEFAEGLPSSGSKASGLDRVLLERNLEKLLQERGSHSDENHSELGRYTPSSRLNKHHQQKKIR